mgnify:CR=1 FL=1
MKNFLFGFLLLMSCSVFAQTAKVAAPPAKFKELKHAFGKIPQNKPVTYVFKFTNASSKALIIESALAGCGCTTPEYPKQPIAKGKEGTIRVTYNAAAVGAFTKDVTVKFVGITEPVVLNISGEVLAEKPKS